MAWTRTTCPSARRSPTSPRRTPASIRRSSGPSPRTHLSRATPQALADETQRAGGVLASPPAPRSTHRPPHQPMRRLLISFVATFAVALPVFVLLTHDSGQPAATANPNL